MTNAPLPDLLTCAVEAACTAGTYALTNYSRRRETISVHAHDVKLKLDVECQEQAEAVIRSHYPDHDVMGEEETANSLPSRGTGMRWIIDPIDGTVNFSHGAPSWCCSVAAELNGEVVAGAVYGPVLEECYAATVDTSSTCNDTAIRVSDTAALGSSIVRTGVDKIEDDAEAACEIFKRIAGAVRRPRVVGSAALDICSVACGRCDGYFETGIYLWDIAAADLIVRRAGGRTCRVGGPLPHQRLAFVASNGRIHDDLVALVEGD